MTSINIYRCPRCGGRMRFKETYYDEKRGLCYVYECRDCGYRETYCVKYTYEHYP